MKRMAPAILFFALLLSGEIHAATIHLNDGSVIIGEVVSSDGTYFKIQSSLGLLSIPARDIRDIALKPVEESPSTTARPAHSGSAPSTDAAARETAPKARDSVAGGGSGTGGQPDFTQMIMSDQKSMEIVLSLGSDPEFKALAADPKIQAAIKAGDVSALLADPRFVKLMERREVKDISSRMGK